MIWRSAIHELSGYPGPIVDDPSIILPCPFCRGKAEERSGSIQVSDNDGESWYAIGCPDCGVWIDDSQDSVEMTIEKWNRRASDPELREQIALAWSWHEKYLALMSIGGRIKVKEGDWFDAYSNLIEWVKHAPHYDKCLWHYGKDCDCGLNKIKDGLSI